MIKDWNPDTFKPLEHFPSPNKTVAGDMKSRLDPAEAVWFEYMKRAHDVFIDRVDEQESFKMMESIGVYKGVIRKCVDESFTGKDYSKNDNVVLRSSAEDWISLGTQLYPQLVINGMTFKGRLTPDNVFEAICASFQREPRQCHKF